MWTYSVNWRTDSDQTKSALLFLTCTVTLLVILFAVFLAITVSLLLFSLQIGWRMMILLHCVHKTARKSTGGKAQESSWLPRPVVRAHQQQEGWKNLTDTGQEMSHSVKSVVTRRAQNFSSGNCPSNVWSVTSQKTSRQISVSRVLPSWLYKKQAKLTWSDTLKIPTCAPSTPNV